VNAQDTAGRSIFAIGDVHGCAEELRELLNTLPITADSIVVFIGDYVDRGPDSRGVIDEVIRLRYRCQVISLMGNHEEMFLAYLEQPKTRRAAEFIMNGGSSTLANYADETGHFDVPPEHRAFLRELKLYWSSEDYFFVHAGVPDVSLSKLDPARHATDLLWTRNAFFNSSFKWDKTIVHGHTPIRMVEITPKRVNIDTGCVYGNQLTAIELPNLRVYTVPARAKERVLLRDSNSRRAALRFDGSLPVSFVGVSDDVHFETVNLSEIGLLVRQTEPPDFEGLEPGQKLEGVVGDDAATQVSFFGMVVRRKKQQDGVYYAMQIVLKQNSD
jgi:serine/threonine protein phosphatase 1